MINEDKILAYLQDVIKAPLVEKVQEHLIIVKSDIYSPSKFKELIEFCNALHYNVWPAPQTFKGIVISPK